MESLFDEVPGFDRDRFQSQIRSLAERRIFIGGSSWKYEGWLGQIYSRSRYQVRGRFSKKLFETTCLSEYASVFPTVCGDFAFYQFPTEEFWSKLFAQVPPGFRFALKAPEQITCRIFPGHARHGAQSGMRNDAFLDSDLFAEGFLQALEPYRDRTALIVFEFGAFSPQAFGHASEFFDRLDPFLASLPKGWRYSVEIRNPGFLMPDYFQLLAAHGVAHVYNAWTRMPALPDQLALPDSITAEFLVCRALLRRGRAYEDAVRLFSPYQEVRDVDETTRRGLRELIQIARMQDRTAFIFVNNRLEGNAPGTIVSILDED